MSEYLSISTLTKYIKYKFDRITLTIYPLKR